MEQITQGWEGAADEMQPACGIRCQPAGPGLFLESQDEKLTEGDFRSCSALSTHVKEPRLSCQAAVSCVDKMSQDSQAASPACELALI